VRTSATTLGSVLSQGFQTRLFGFDTPIPESFLGRSVMSAGGKLSIGEVGTIL
jgi:hypothetical protein